MLYILLWVLKSAFKSPHFRLYSVNLWQKIVTVSGFLLRVVTTPSVVHLHKEGATARKQTTQQGRGCSLCGFSCFGNHRQLPLLRHREPRPQTEPQTVTVSGFLLRVVTTPSVVSSSQRGSDSRDANQTTAAGSHHTRCLLVTWQAWRVDRT